MNLFILIFVLLGNLWVWRIFAFSFIPGLLVLATSVFLYLLLEIKSKNSKTLFIIFFLLLLIFQWRTTSRVSLTELGNDEQRIQQMRLREYPSAWLRVGHWFEERPESIAFFRILNNFSEVIDPNLYFFANHPRERVGVVEFEKFPYIFLPFFFYGLFLSKDKGNRILLFSMVIPLVITSLIGSKSPIGPISLFPFISVFTTVGIKNIQRPILIGSLVIFALVLLQTISYALY